MDINYKFSGEKVKIADTILLSIIQGAHRKKLLNSSRQNPISQLMSYFIILDQGLLFPMEILQIEIFLLLVFPAVYLCAAVSLFSLLFFKHLYIWYSILLCPRIFLLCYHIFIRISYQKYNILYIIFIFKFFEN